MLKDDWHDYFISLLGPIASKSKDPRTKVGCLITKNKKIVSTGYNGFPKGVKDLSERYEDRELKYKFICHAERNAIDFAKRDLEGCTIYVSWIPCSNCTKSIIQVGIKEVVVDGSNYEEKLKHWDAWKEDVEISKVMLNEAGVKLTIYGVN